MSEQREVEAIVGNPKTHSEIFSSLDRAGKKARIAAVRERGITNDRLSVALPSHLHGEWINRDPFEILRMEGIGFKIDTEYATKRALHNVGDGSAVIGDVVFMTCPREVKELIDEVAAEQFKITNGDPSIRNRTKQKGDIPEQVNAQHDFDIRGSRVIDESVESSIDGNELKAAIESATMSQKPS